MVSPQEGWIYCPALSMWRTPLILAKHCKVCPYFGCKHNMDTVVSLPVTLARERAIKRSLAAQDKLSE